MVVVKFKSQERGNFYMSLNKNSVVYVFMITIKFLIGPYGCTTESCHHDGFAGRMQTSFLP